ncbi:MAG TPA: amidohydrolase family protein, partial [Ktedonobacterales bacterium]|nr:amidohydrolase family protein [Ktedonobacterales bacterium]
ALRQAGAKLALGSDVPVDTPDPWRILHAAINRQNAAEPDRPAWLPDQALSVAQAIWGYTVGAAWAGGQEERQGSLAPGKLADLIVLSDDPFTAPPERIAQTQVLAALVGGQLVHGALE